ncbi:MAG: NAD(+) synthase [Caldisericaceae bacterium]|nr:NAD(+) synthase [Caldisericaceae bacterium]RLD20727.1 MAG: NAD(+) synthase [Caldisericota bacterium]
MKKFKSIKKEVVQQVVDFIAQYTNKLEKEGVVIGISGGIDSAVAAAVAKEAIGKDKLTLVHISERDTLKKNKISAQIIADFIGVPLKKKNITVPLISLGIYSLESIGGFFAPENIKVSYVKKRFNKISKDKQAYLNHISGKGNEQYRKDIAYYETKARLITVVLYKYANLENKIVIDTSNKTELSIGHCIRYGEVGDIRPLGDLYKTEIMELAKYMGIPEQILNKPPSPDIIPGITDELAIGLSYEKIDQILLHLENKLHEKEIAKELKIDEKEVQYIKKLCETAKLYTDIPIKLKLKHGN